MSKVNASAKPNMKGVNKSSTYAYDNGERKIIDPVVAKLKEARRLEKEKKEKELREKKGLAPKPKPKPKLKLTIPMRTSGNSNLPKRDKSKSKSPGKDVKPIVQPRRPVTKMNFNDLMKKATTIDQSKLSISFKSKSRSPETSSGPGKHIKPKTSSDRPLKSHNPKPIVKKPTKSTSPPQINVPAKLTAPIPTRKPSEKLAAKLKQKQQSKEEVEYESDMDSFIASDEEDYQRDVGYDRDEIWKMFNKGKSRSDFQYDDYDSDDMEATGAEILEEELRSKRRAELEDRRELEEEQRRAELKRQRKMKLGR